MLLHAERIELSSGRIRVRVINSGGTLVRTDGIDNNRRYADLFIIPSKGPKADTRSESAPTLGCSMSSSRSLSSEAAPLLDTKTGSGVGMETSTRAEVTVGRRG